MSGKIEVGDLVHFRDDLIIGEMYGLLMWRDNMSKRISGVVTHYDKADDTFLIEYDTHWYSKEMVEKVDGRMSLIENQRELKRLEEELKLHRADFRNEIAELTKVRDELKAENERLRQEALEMDEADLEDGVSISWQNDFKVNIDELDDDYLMTVVDEKRIKKELIQSEWTKPINGVEILKVPRLRVSVK